MTYQYAAKLIKSKEERELKPLLLEMIGDELSLPAVTRVDGERGFTVELKSELLKKGIADVQTTPPYDHKAAGFIENANKNLLEALRLTMHDLQLNTEEW